MRKNLLICLAAIAGLASPALAQQDPQETGAYAGLNLGAAFVDSEKFKNGTDLYKAGSDPGVNVSGHAGYDFGLFRLEGEIGFQTAGGDKFTLLDDTALVELVNLSSGDETKLRGTRSALSGMVNGLIDIPTKSPWEGFIGGGLGIAQINNNKLRISDTSLIDDDKSAFAWQGMAGVRRALSPDIDFSVQYRYFQASNRNFPDQSLARTVRGGFASHSLLAGLTYKFGRAAPEPARVPAATPAPVPEPQPQPAPEPAPVVQAPPPAPGPFLVFFDWDSAAITPEAAAIISDAAQAFRDTGQVRILVEGHTDRSGPATYNDGLSSRRAQAVEAALAAHGITGDDIATRGYGENAPLIETLDGVREPQNRRVEITFPQ